MMETRILFAVMRVLEHWQPHNSHLCVSREISFKTVCGLILVFLNDFLCLVKSEYLANVSLVNSKHTCFKWAIPSLYFVYFRSFQTNIKIFTSQCEKCPSSKQWWDSNTRPSEYESPPITTRPEACMLDLLYFCSVRTWLANETDGIIIGRPSINNFKKVWYVVVLVTLLLVLTFWRLSQITILKHTLALLLIGILFLVIMVFKDIAVSQTLILFTSVWHQVSSGYREQINLAYHGIYSAYLGAYWTCLASSWDQSWHQMGLFWHWLANLPSERIIWFIQILTSPISRGKNEMHWTFSLENNCTTI